HFRPAARKFHFENENSDSSARSPIPSSFAVSDGCAMSAKLFVLLQLRYIVEVGAPIKSVGSRPREPGPNLRPHPPTPPMEVGADPAKFINLPPIIAADVLKEG